MQLSHIFLGLIATVSAIDMYGYRDSDTCGGGYIVCTNANPGDCCIFASGEIFRSIQWRAIPTDWQIIGVAFGGFACQNVKFSVPSIGRENICAGGNLYSGGNYQFASRKRSEDANEACPATGGCANVKRGDLMVFEDGPSYNLTDLDDVLYTELVNASIHPRSYLVQSLHILTFCVSLLVRYKGPQNALTIE